MVVGNWYFDTHCKQCNSSVVEWVMAKQKTFSKTGKTVKYSAASVRKLQAVTKKAVKMIAPVVKVLASE